jgi:hypothetical protein
VAFQKSDLFFICVLRPLSNDISIDEAEIQAAKVHHAARPVPCRVDFPGCVLTSHVTCL